MEPLKKCIKVVNCTFFNRLRSISINDIKEGDIVYIKVKSPLNYGVSEWEYYGRIIKITKCYFQILHYFEASMGINECRTESISKIEADPSGHIKKWAKKSIVEICTLETVQEEILKEYYSN